MSRSLTPSDCAMFEAGRANVIAHVREWARASRVDEGTAYGHGHRAALDALDAYLALEASTELRPIGGPALRDAREAVTTAIVVLGGLTELWSEMPYAERCARAEAELRHLADRLDVALAVVRDGACDEAQERGR